MSTTGPPTGEVPMPAGWQLFRALVAQAGACRHRPDRRCPCLRTLGPARPPGRPGLSRRAVLQADPCLPGRVPDTPDDPAAPTNRAAWEVAVTRAGTPGWPPSVTPTRWLEVVTGGCAHAPRALTARVTVRTLKRPISITWTSPLGAPRPGLSEPLTADPWGPAW